MKTLRDKKGQGLIEALLALPVVMAALTCLALLSYRALVFYSADYLLHEALICSSYLSPRDCEKELKSQLQRLLLGGSIKEVRISKSSYESKGLVALNLIQSTHTSLRTFDLSFKIEKQLKLPIKVR
jgi:hypothetical protein